MATKRLQIILAGQDAPEALTRAVQRVGAQASYWPLKRALQAEDHAAADAIVIVVPRDARKQSHALRVLFDRIAEDPRATLVLKPEGECVTKVSHPPSVPVSFACDLDDADLAVRLQTMFEMRSSLRTLHRGAVDRGREKAEVMRRYQNQMRIAQQVQRELMTEPLAGVGALRFSTVSRSVDYVSGDILDVAHIDDEHVGIAVVDATGHGLPAALLTVFIKRALRGVRENGAAPNWSPADVLTRLNAELFEAELSDCPFVAATYAVVNVNEGTVQLARGGAPYPIIRRANGSLEQIRTDGMVVGVVPDATYEVATLSLEADDELVLYTDGLDHIALTNGALPAPTNGATTSEVMAATLGDADNASTALLTETATLDAQAAQSPWFKTLRADGGAAALEYAAARFDTLRRMGSEVDDLTLVAARFRPAG